MSKIKRFFGLDDFVVEPISAQKRKEAEQVSKKRQQDAIERILNNYEGVSREFLESLPLWGDTSKTLYGFEERLKEQEIENALKQAKRKV